MGTQLQLSRRHLQQPRPCSGASAKPRERPSAILRCSEPRPSGFPDDLPLLSICEDQSRPPWHGARCQTWFIAVYGC